MKVRKRLLIGSLAVSLVASILGIASIIGLAANALRVNDMLARAINKERALAQTHATLRTVMRSRRTLAVAPDDEEKRNAPPADDAKESV